MHMDQNIMNLEQATEFLGVSEKTLIKLLREEHFPARKIGREWRFSKEAIIAWLATGDSSDYSNRSDLYQYTEEVSGKTVQLYKRINDYLYILRDRNNHVQRALEGLDREAVIPEEANLKVSYRQDRETEELEFKIVWDAKVE